jgi:recombination protein RecA
MSTLKPLNQKDKKAAITNALAQINKQHGEGTAMMMGANKHMQVEALSSGILSIDLATGVGGVPRGRVVEIYGPESGGKCLVADTLIATPGGLKTIAEVFEENGLPASCVSRTTEKRVPLINRYGEVEYTTHFTHNNRRKVARITTFTGAQTTSTLNHPHLVLSVRGNLVWRKTSDLRVGDILVAPRSLPFGEARRDADEMYMLGLLVADGTLGENRVQVTNDDPVVKSFVEERMPALVGAGPKSYVNNERGSVNYHFNGKEAVSDLYARYGLDPVKASGKEVPRLVRESDRDAVREFLRGYMDSECSIDLEKCGIEVTSASGKLLRGVKLLLQQFGIVSLLRPKEVKGYEQNDYWRLTVTGRDARLYAERIGARSEIRRAQLMALPQREQFQTNYDSIPHLGGMLRDLYDSCETTRHESDLLCDYMGDEPRASLTYDRLKQIVETPAFQDAPILAALRRFAEDEYLFDAVVSIEDGGEQPTFDFAMERTHSFVANGLVTHNTTTTLHFVAECQRRGGQCAFVDAEHALDPAYAKALGVDVDTLIVSQPDYGEQALDVVESLAASGAIDLIIVDSVAALTPKAEIEGEMGDSQVGAQARMMGKAMRKLTATAGRTRCTIIFINQIREKVGVMFGNPEVTTGGRALRFFSSMRLEVRRVETIKVDGQEVANRVKVKLAKNKVSRPFTVAEAELTFGFGFSRAASILDTAEANGLIQKSGAWYAYSGQKIGQGRAKAIEFLNANPEIADKLDKTLREKFFAAPTTLDPTVRDDEEDQEQED